VRWVGKFRLEGMCVFVADALANTATRPLFNRVVTLKDGWSGKEIIHRNLDAMKL